MRGIEMRVLVVGGGIAGLALGSHLSRERLDVTVVERADLSGAAGSGLSLFSNGIRALDSLGLGAEVRRACGSMQPRIESGLRTPDGRLRARTAKKIADALVVVDRTDLKDCLLEQMGDGTLCRSAEVVEVSEESVLLSSGEELSGFDVLVGADGLRSTVRRSKWGASDPGVRDAGYFACRGITAVPVDVGCAGEIWGRAQRFGIAPLPDGRVYWFSVANGRPPSANDAHVWTRNAYAGWVRDVGAVITETDPDAVQPLPIEELGCALGSYVRGRTVLVGDAAHAMTPNLGQGANQGLEDVAVLADELVAVNRGERTIAQALRQYDRVRRWRSQLVARASGWVGRVAQAEAGILARGRNFVLGT